MLQYISDYVSPPSFQKRAIAMSESESSSVDQGKKDFYISCTPHDSRWAQWIAFHLKEQGYSFILPELDFRPGTNIILETHKAVSQCERTIALLSPHYVTAMYTSPDWTVAFQEGEVGEEPRLLPIRIQQCEIEGILKPYRIIDLVELVEDAAREKLVSVLKRNPPQLKQPPRFPGSAATILGLLPDRNPLFLGREEILKSLYRFLHAGHTIVALTPSVSTEKGHSIGKTAIAVEYAYRNQCEYDTIFWLSQNPEDPSPEPLLETIKQVAEKLDGTVSQIEKTHYSLHILKQWLESHTNWLLILDGIATTQVMQKQEKESFEYLEQADILLLLISANFFSCSEFSLFEERVAIYNPSKHRHVIPIILHSVDWIHSPFGHLAPLPEGGKPITHCRNRDAAFSNVAKDIRVVIEQLIDTQR
jgi:hypothetical protein